VSQGPSGPDGMTREARLGHENERPKRADKFFEVALLSSECASIRYYRGFYGHAGRIEGRDAWTE
jgi:hypothetical protein